MKRKPKMHKLTNISWWGTSFVVCGLDVHNQFTRKSWAGVTCKNCLRRKGKR